jgi:hypothetical protein
VIAHTLRAGFHAPRRLFSAGQLRSARIGSPRACSQRPSGPLGIRRSPRPRVRRQVELPTEPDVLGHGGHVQGAASGKLPGGADGTLLFYTYTYTWTDSDDHTHHEERPFTLVVTRVPESIGFVPYLGFSGKGSKLSAAAGSLGEVRKLDLGEAEGLKETSAYVYKGTSESWITQLISPAMIDWLARCEDEFGFELASGVLVVGLDRHRGGKFLQTLCEDAAHLATALREESVEETETGGAEADAAKDPNAAEPRMETALGEVRATPADVLAATPAFRRYLRRSPYTYWRALRFALLLTLALNIPAAAIPILLAVNGKWAWLAGFELGLILLIACFAFRSRLGDKSRKYATEAFYRGYAAEREMKLEEPLHFAATHAEAKLPFKPDRVLTGPLPGGPTNGSLVLVGDGSKRADRIAVLAGPKGPLAEAELHAAAPGISAKLLDSYAKRLSGELAATVK